MFKTTKLEFIFIIFILCLIYLNLNGFSDDSLYTFILVLMILTFYFKNNDIINDLSVFLMSERERNVIILENIFSEKNLILSSIINNETNIVVGGGDEGIIRGFNEHIFTYYSLVVSNLNEFHKTILIKNQINALIASINR